ncbi:MAG: hypothetical protein Q4E11_08760 [Corynebacterium sp.]|nr:hypothetical protein [Corynebacterium sp.]MDO5030656.1 hypothetical protein [Corynebacterium sp.]
MDMDVETLQLNKLTEIENLLGELDGKADKVIAALTELIELERKKDA